MGQLSGNRKILHCEADKGKKSGSWETWPLPLRHPGRSGQEEAWGSSWRGGQPPVVQPTQEWRGAPRFPPYQERPPGLPVWVRALAGAPILTEKEGFNLVVMAPHMRSPHIVNLGKQRVFCGTAEGVPASPHASEPLIREPSGYKCQPWVRHTGVPILILHLQAKCSSVPQRLSFLIWEMGEVLRLASFQGLW